MKLRVTQKVNGNYAVQRHLALNIWFTVSDFIFEHDARAYARRAIDKHGKKTEVIAEYES